MKRIRNLTLTVLLVTFATIGCGSQSNPVIDDTPATRNLSYKVKLNGSSEVTIQYLTPESELVEITVGLPGGIQEFKFDFQTPSDVHYISATVPETDSTHTLLFVTAGGFTKAGKYFVEISF